MSLLKEIIYRLLMSRAELSTGYPQTHPNGAPQKSQSFIFAILVFIIYFLYKKSQALRHKIIDLQLSQQITP
jgi:hypothetical protein